jgi:tRNA U34 5-methylaminomethyl-2-thiouridine-forming methyltransferase MnmC
MQTNPSKTLAYTALEKYPLAEPVVAQYHTQVGTSPHIVQVISTLPASGTVGNVVYDLRTTPLEPNLELGSCFDIVYFDPFGPHAAPEMWEPPMLDAVFRHIAPGGFLATFSVTGHFKRYLRQRGIPFQRMPGFGRKRERMLAGPMPNIFLALHSH